MNRPAVQRTRAPEEVSGALRAAISTTRRGDYEAALRVFSAIFADSRFEMTSALSYYGLCIAKVEKKYNPAIKLCERAIEAEFFDAEHYVNLIDVYLQAGSRKKAVEVLERALGRMPKDDLLIAKKSAMGFRSPPVISFLARTAHANIVLGKLRHRRRLRIAERKRARGILFLWLIPGFIVWIALVLWFLIANS